MILGVYNDCNHPLVCLPPLRIKEYIRVADQLGIVLAFFDIRDVNLEVRKIQAKIVKDSELHSLEINFPEVVLNEGAAKNEHKLHAENEKAFRQEVQFLSHSIDNKLKIYEILKRVPSIQSHMISTSLLASFKPFLHMKPRTRVLIKPFDGRKGQGIIVIEKLITGKFHVIEQESHHILTVHELKSQVSKLAQRKNHVLQPFIISTTGDGCTFHLRTHICRGAQAEWHVLATIADVAEAGRLTSNYEGVQTKWASDFLKEAYGDKANDIHEQLVDLTLKIANELEMHYPFTLNELALDFGLNADGHLYFFEANTGPEIIEFAKEREPARAEHLLAYASQIHHAIESVPLENRRGLVFKVT